MHINVKECHILYYNIYTGCLLHVHVSGILVAVLREVSTKDILQKLQEPVHIARCKMHGLKCVIKYKIRMKFCAQFKRGTNVTCSYCVVCHHPEVKEICLCRRRLLP